MTDQIKQPEKFSSKQPNIENPKKKNPIIKDIIEKCKGLIKILTSPVVPTKTKSEIIKKVSDGGGGSGGEIDDGGGGSGGGKPPKIIIVREEARRTKIEIF